MAYYAPLFVDTPSGRPDVPVSARDLRAATGATVQAGVVKATDLVKGSPSGMSVPISAGTVYVPDSLDPGALYRCTVDTQSTVTFDPADPSNPRVDQVIAQVLDENVDGGTERRWTITKLTGSPVAGASLDNRTGAAAIPDRAVRLYDQLVPAAAGSVTAAGGRDRRPWARGGRATWPGIASDTTYSSTSVTPVQIPASVQRLEVGSGMVRVAFSGTVTASTGTVLVVATLMVDGAPIGGGVGRQVVSSVTQNGAFTVSLAADVTLPAGSHTFGVAVHPYATGYTANLYNSTAIGKPKLTVDEILPPIVNQG